MIGALQDQDKYSAIFAVQDGGEEGSGDMGMDAPFGGSTDFDTEGGSPETLGDMKDIEVPSNETDGSTETTEETTEASL